MKNLKVASYNISCGFYNDDDKTEFLDRSRVDNVDNKMISQIIDYINKEDLDIICFQEMIAMNDFQFLETIASRTDLKHFHFFENSECHVINNAQMGIALMSKYPIKNIYTGFFPNPKLTKTTSSGNTYHIFDKGYIICDIDIDGEILRVFNHHGFPFRRFNSTARDNMAVFEEFDRVIKEYDPDIVAGDFDTEDFMKLVDQFKNYTKTINDVTEVYGYRLDNILIKPGIKYTSKVTKLLSDHYLVQCEF